MKTSTYSYYFSYLPLTTYKQFNTPPFPSPLPTRDTRSSLLSTPLFPILPSFPIYHTLPIISPFTIHSTLPILQDKNSLPAPTKTKVGKAHEKLESNPSSQPSETPRQKKIPRLASLIHPPLDINTILLSFLFIPFPISQAPESHYQ